MGKKCKYFICVISLLLSATVGFATTTTTQNIVININKSYTGVSAIRIFDGSTTNPTITFSESYPSTYIVPSAGLENTTSSIDYNTLLEKEGGYLQYTVRGYTGDFKITVHSPTPTYTNDSLYVKGFDPETSENSSGLDTLGTVVSMARYDGGGLCIPRDSGNARDFITGIDGVNTLTGTEVGSGVEGKNDGALLLYGFESEPGVDTIAVTYTILAETASNM